MRRLFVFAPTGGFRIAGRKGVTVSHEGARYYGIRAARRTLMFKGGLRRIGLVGAGVGLCMLLCLTCGPASATSSIEFDGFANGKVMARVVFTLGDLLEITLTNTAMMDPATAPSQVLTGLFFDFVTPPGGSLMRPATATVADGSDVANRTFSNRPLTGTNPGGDVGTEWAFEVVNYDEPPPGLDQGISSAGLGLFGPNDLITPIGGEYVDLYPPRCPDGVAYGLVSKTYVDGTGNGGILDQPLIRNSVDFTFTTDLPYLYTGDGTDSDYWTIRSVWFQYGTSLDDPSNHGTPLEGVPVPEPVSMVMLGCLGAGMLAARKLRGKRAA